MKKIISSIVAIATALSVFAFATPAMALGVTVGNAAINRSTVDTYSDFTIIDTNNPVSANGWLTTFGYYASNTNPFEFVLVDGSNMVKWVSAQITPAGTGFQVSNQVVAVTAGWNLGVHFDSTGTIPFDWTGTPASYTPNNNGMPVVGQTLTQEGTSNRTYSWNGNGTDATTCATITLTSSTSTQFKNLTLSDPGSSSSDGSFTLGTSGNAVAVGPDGYPGAWDGAINDPNLVGAIFVNNSATAPTPGGAGDGQDGSVNVWRLFSHNFAIPVGATISAADLYLSADNSVEAFMDNTSVGSAPGFGAATPMLLPLPTSGAHELEFVVKNDAYTEINPTGLIYRAVINYCAPTTPPVTECPAAPAVANAYLKAHNIKPNSVLGKNIISRVAKNMTQQAYFGGVGPCDPTYDDLVEAFIEAITGV